MKYIEVGDKRKVLWWFMNEYVWLQLTKSQAQNLMELIDLWFYREIREDADLDNIMWAWEILDIYKQCKDGVYKNVINNLQSQEVNNESIRND